MTSSFSNDVGIKKNNVEKKSGTQENSIKENSASDIYRYLGLYEGFWFIDI